MRKSLLIVPPAVLVSSLSSNYLLNKDADFEPEKQQLEEKGTQIRHK